MSCDEMQNSDQWVINRVDSLRDNLELFYYNWISEMVSQYSTNPLFYRNSNQGLVLNVHLFGRLYFGCIMYGTLFHSHSKSNEETKIHKGKWFAQGRVNHAV